MRSFPGRCAQSDGRFNPHNATPLSGYTAFNRAIRCVYPAGVAAGGPPCRATGTSQSVNLRALLVGLWPLCGSATPYETSSPAYLGLARELDTPVNAVKVISLSAGMLWLGGLQNVRSLRVETAAPGRQRPWCVRGGIFPRRFRASVLVPSVLLRADAMGTNTPTFRVRVQSWSPMFGTRCREAFPGHDQAPLCSRLSS